MDITERKLNENQLRQLSNRLLLAKEASNTGIWDWDIPNDSILLDWESAHMFGLPRETQHLDYQSWLAIIHPKDRERVHHRLQIALNSGRTNFNISFRTLYLNREIRHFTLNALIERDRSGKPIRMVAANWDITETKAMEVQFLRSQRMESIGTLAGGIAHNLNNALTPAVLALDILKEKIRNPELNELIETIQKSAQQATYLVRQILSFARGVEVNYEVLNIEQLANDLSRIILNSFPPNIDLETSIAPGLCTVTADPIQIHQALLNICLNARDAMPQGGTLRIRFENQTVSPQQAESHLVQPGLYLLIKVEDTGCGMTEEVISQLFNPFFTTKETGKGTGLGLPSALGIIKGHQGFIEVFSEPQIGSSFQVYLPAGENGPTGKPVLKEAMVAPRKGTTILIVDDQEPIRKTMRRTLELQGHQIIEAENAQRGLEHCNVLQDEISLVLTDITMPGIDGYTFILELRRLRPKLPIIVISGAHANQQGSCIAIDPLIKLLPKPFDRQTLLRMVNDSLKASGAIS